MMIRNISITENSEQIILYCARVSNPKNQDSGNTKLIRYCIEHGHWSIFEMAHATYEITTSRAIAAQILRHRSFSFQEFCISGDSLIRLVLPSGNTYTRTIKHLYNYQKHKNQHGMPSARVFDGDKFISAKIKEVFYTGEKPTYKIKLSDGKEITCTKEHKFLTQLGYDTLENIIGLQHHKNKVSMSKVGVIATNGIPLHQSKEWLEQKKQESIINKIGLQYIADEAGVSYHTIRKWLKTHNISYSKSETASYKTVWNKGKFGYKNKPHTIETRLKMKNCAKRGKESNLWRGGVDRTERQKIGDWCNTIRKDKLQEYNYQCSICLSTKNLELDHILPVYSNPEQAYNYDNIQVLCKKCHNEKHNLNGDQKIWKSHNRGNALTVKWVTIESIEYIGIQDTYDLEVDHETHNYVANGIVVHNSQRYAKAQTYVPVEARRQDKRNRQNSIDDLPEDVKAWFSLCQEYIWEESHYLYEKALELGIAKEQARNVLPLSTETKLYMSGSIRSWIHYFQVRCSVETQKEHRDIALQIRSDLAMRVPHIAQALQWKSADDEFLENLLTTAPKHDTIFAC